jgi:predicted nuclease with TOPRIM domain
MKILRRLKDTHFIKKRIKELEASIRSKDELIQRLEKENSSLQTRLRELVFKYRDIDSKLAGMNYRLYELTRENKILTVNLVGARAQRDGMQRWIEKMKEHVYGSNNK